MSDVTLHVGGRNYTVACEDGQEANVERLAAVVDAKLKAMGANLSTQESKNLLFAALLLADELEETKSAPAPSPPPLDFDSERVAGQLERLASALENAAATLEGGASVP